MTHCPTCNDSGHVCENHPDKPWGGICCDQPREFTGHCQHGACHCGGAGMPCAACCSPIPEDGSTPIGLAFTPDWRRG